MKLFSEDKIWQLLRFYLSFILLWAFFDKLFGFGLATASSKSWLAGVSPTTGFLQFGLKGSTFASFFNSLAGNQIIDLLFMSGLFLIGLSLLLGIGMRIACYSGALLMFTLYLSLFPPENNPILDEHIIYILVFLGLSVRLKTQKFGFGKKWQGLSIVKKHPVLE